MSASTSEARKRSYVNCDCGREITHDEDDVWEHKDGTGRLCYPGVDGEEGTWKAQPEGTPDAKTDLALANERIHVLDAALRALRGALIRIRDELEPYSQIDRLAKQAIDTAADAVAWRPEED